MGDHIRRKRLDLGQGQRVLARRLGVREETVHLWEAGRARPLPRHYGRIVRFLGYDPEPVASGLGQRVRSRRRARGLSPAELATLLGIDEGTVVDLEGERRRISCRVLALARDFLDEPDGRP